MSPTKEGLNPASDFALLACHICPEILHKGTRPVVKSSVAKIKYQLEVDVRAETGHLVIVGDTATKLRHGLRDEESAEYFGLEALRDNLIHKINDAPCFNIWIAHNDGSRIAEVEAEVLRFVCDRVNAYVQEVVFRQPRLPLRDAMEAV
jgi:uncharacterized protein with HEPN domain